MGCLTEAVKPSKVKKLQEMVQPSNDFEGRDFDFHVVHICTYMHICTCKYIYVHISTYKYI